MFNREEKCQKRKRTRADMKEKEEEEGPMGLDWWAEQDGSAQGNSRR